jgi:hypothetical protein
MAVLLRLLSVLSLRVFADRSSLSIKHAQKVISTHSAQQQKGASLRGVFFPFNYAGINAPG